MPAYFLITVGYMELLLCYPYTWNMVGDGDRSEVSGDSLTIPRRPDDSLTGIRIWPPSTPVIRQKIDFDLVKHFHSFRFSVYSGHRYKLFARMSGHTNAEVIFKASPCVEVLKVKRDNVSPAHPHSVPRDDEAILEVFRFELLDQNPMQLTFWIDEKSQITTQNHPLSNQRVWKQRIDPNGIPATSTGGTLNNQSLGWNRQSLGWNRQSLGWNRQAHPSTMIPSTAVNGGLQMSARQRLPSVPLNQNAYHFQHQPVGQFTPPSMGHQTAALNHDLQHIMLLQAQLEKKRLQAQLLLDGQATQRHPKNEQTRDGVGPLNRGVLMGLQYPTQDNGCPLRYENHEKQYPSTSNVNRMHGNSQANFQHQTLARTDHSDDPNYMQPHGS
uniref:Uncharacterized protein n=1 Tax=Lankesteria abbotti TaxID=340204 RepID=A0A7S2QQF4_9APIC|mmetsp:Transcript_1407/g.1611  ORF Transcript_1407/g.1611 Transcript_1407/m.1611 type:complete len:384 (+) Transcript_1407:154-1305(+)